MNSGVFAVLIPGPITVESSLNRPVIELSMTLAHLNDAEAKAETLTPGALLMAIRDKLALGPREEL